MEQQPEMLLVLDSTVNIQQLCRLCGCKTEIINRINIFDSSDNSIDFPSMIKSCLSIDISEIDNLPKVACFSCVNNLENFSKFKITCETTAQLLSSLCNQQNSTLDSEQNVHSDPVPFDTTTELVEPEKVFINSEYIDEENCSEIIIANPKPKKSKKVRPSSKKQTKKVNKCMLTVNDDKSHVKTKRDVNKPIKGIKSKTFTCDICSKTFRCWRSVPRHMSLIHFPPSERVTCKLCNRNFKDNTTLKAHIRSLHEKKFVYFCDFCGQGFMAKNPFENHIRTKHTKERPFECPQCDKKYTSKLVLQNHIESIHESIEWICDICNRSCPSKKSLQRHKVIHVVHKKKLQCHICNIKVSDNYRLKKHMKRHTGEKPFVCKICGKSYSDKHSLNIHTLTHTGERKHVCEVCGSAFALPGNLKVHKISVHEGIKMFKCNDCDKSYTQNSSLNIHLKKTGHTRLKNISI